MEIGTPKRVVEAEPLRDPVPDREPTRLPESPLPTPQPQPSPQEPIRVEAPSYEAYYEVGE
jgi:hypothetical protein